MTNKKFSKLFGREPRAPESALTQDDMDIAPSVQVVTEEIVLKVAQTVHRETEVDHLCLAGGVSSTVWRTGGYSGKDLSNSCGFSQPPGMLVVRWVVHLLFGTSMQASLARATILSTACRVLFGGLILLVEGTAVALFIYTIF